MNLYTLWTLATAEMRSCRRFTRTWVFIVLAILICAGWYIGLLVESMNDLRPPTGWDHDAVSTRFTGATILITFVAIYSFGIIFLAFDISARDRQDRIRDVMDSLPSSNVEIIVGRVAGIITLLLMPCVFFLILVTGYEIIASLLDFHYRVGMQPMSVVSFVVWNIIPNLVFFSSLVVFLSVLIRFRILVAMIALGVLIGSVWIAEHIPVRLQESLSLYVGSATFPSDLASIFVTPTIAGNRLVIVLVSVALLVFAASLLPRTDPRRMTNTLIGVFAAGLAIAMFFSLVFTVQRTENVKAQWIETHGQQSPSAFPDVQHLAGNIELHPGRKIILDITLTLLTPPANTADSVVLSLNPGYRIQNVSIDGAETTEFSFEKGILKLPMSLLPAVLHEIRVQAMGKPDDRFAYLDQARDFQILKDRRVPKFGLRSYIFHADFVALMPGTVWYPISGTAIDRDKIEERPRDLFTTDLTVSVPRNWQVATVGRRQIIETQKRLRFQFTNHSPVSEFALIASNFDQRKSTVGGVEIELLFSKKHLHNLEVLSPISDRINQWIVDRIQIAREFSLEYPYESFYVVEVPSSLRIYGGGWRMDSVLQPPGMMLIRETAFPTAPFDAMLDSLADESDSEDELHESAFNELLNYFANDQQGGNPFAGMARNFLSHQVSATGQGATTLQFLLDHLANRLITQQESSMIISESEFDTQTPNLFDDVTPNFHSRRTTAARSRNDISTLPSTWEVMERIPLVDLDFRSRPISSYRVLLTKGQALAKSMIARYGVKKTGMLLHQLKTKYAGQSFTLMEFLDTASFIGLDLSRWVIPWFEDSDLPGFLVEVPKVSKLENPEFGKAEFQTTFILHNAQEVPGYIRIAWTDKDELRRLYMWESGEYDKSDPILVAGRNSKRIAIRSVDALTEIWIVPFLSLNRVPVKVEIPVIQEQSLPESVALPFVTDVAWHPPDSHVIVVDDLDPNFSIVNYDADSAETIESHQVLHTSNTRSEYDRGLRIGNIIEPGEWIRVNSSRSYGIFRSTHARVAHGDQTSAARFKAHLPETGIWSLEFFVCSSALARRQYWTTHEIVPGMEISTYIVNRRARPTSPDEHYTLEIRDANSARTVKFDIANAKEGWNDVESFEFNSTEVDVLLSDWAGHKNIIVHADAIRWTPVREE